MLWERVGGGWRDAIHVCRLYSIDKAIENNSLYTQLEEK